MELLPSPKRQEKAQENGRLTAGVNLPETNFLLRNFSPAGEKLCSKKKDEATCQRYETLGGVPLAHKNVKLLQMFCSSGASCQLLNLMTLAGIRCHPYWGKVMTK